MIMPNVSYENFEKVYRIENNRGNLVKMNPYKKLKQVWQNLTAKSVNYAP